MECILYINTTDTTNAFTLMRVRASRVFFLFYFQRDILAL